MDSGTILFFVIVGALIVFPMLDALYFYKVTIKKWRCVEGEIIENSPIDDGDGGWVRDIIYKYCVDGTEYTGNRITRNNIKIPFEYQDSYKYHPGTKVTVYYNPNNPEKAIIESTFNVLTLVALFFNVGLFIVFYFILIMR